MSARSRRRRHGSADNRPPDLPADLPPEFAVLRDIGSSLWTDLGLRLLPGSTTTEDLPEINGWWLRDSSGSSIGLWIHPEDIDWPSRLWATTTAVEAHIQEAGASSGRSNWPPCPAHPRTHPLDARMVEDDMVWCCPETSEQVAPVGQLLDS
ncbi:hypothetical protein [Allobranchiibius sp. CTAmp26]|uniref:hypothetical protein n=1 Tax=Allobranchiibius sp. CTAmp26 TaxID=2815214 RepID=UPI001AA176D0|nr:hypothetical protein [Allobranchiibius sp. CTAmp26]MBO1754260.1 hypothetical protein [Allobranchiibius sp. CTAmp26]